VNHCVTNHHAAFHHFFNCLSINHSLVGTQIDQNKGTDLKIERDFLFWF
jgi:hypothetical protein